jgi:hypothetical protein
MDEILANARDLAVRFAHSLPESQSHIRRNDDSCLKNAKNSYIKKKHSIKPNSSN